MTTYKFIFDYTDSRFKVIISNAQNPDKIVKLSLNIEAVLKIDNAIARTVYDIMKDAAEDPRVLNIKEYISKTFFQGEFGGSYTKELQKIENESFFMGDEDVHFNKCKTSTDGGPSIITLAAITATNILYESGLGPEKICATPIQELNIWYTPAARLDSADKVTCSGNHYFPDNNNTIIFDESFTRRLGFPHDLKWSASDISETIANPKHKVTITASKYIDIDTDPLQVEIDLKTNTVSPDENSKTKGLAFYSLAGNKKKNQALNKFTSTDIRHETEIFKYLLLKELGDVAQVWLYYALLIVNLYLTKPEPEKVIQQEIEQEKNNYLMLTTDSIVYFLCKVLQLPAGYTGSRTGVTTGNCTVKYFKMGPLNYKKHLKNLLSMESNRIKQHNNNNYMAILNIIQIDTRRGKQGHIFFDKFIFHIKLPDPKETRYRFVVPDNFNFDKILLGSEFMSSKMDVPSQLKQGGLTDRDLSKEEKLKLSDNIKKKFEALLTKIDDCRIGLEAFVKKKETEFNDKDFTSTKPDQITEMYSKLLNELNEYKCEQYITVLKKPYSKAKYVFNKTKELQDFTICFKLPMIIIDPFYFTEELIPDPIDSLYEDEEVDEMIYEEGPDPSTSPVPVPVAGGDGDGEFNENKNIGYYEYLVLYFVYTFWFQDFKIVDNIVPLTDTEICLFAKYYDELLWYCSNKNWNIDSDIWKNSKIASHFKKIFKNKTDEEIVELGKPLSNYINFEEPQSFNIKLDQLKIKSSKIKFRSSRSSRFSRFSKIKSTKIKSSKIKSRSSKIKSSKIKSRSSKSRYFKLFKDATRATNKRTKYSVVYTSNL